ncbi:hypothetical protein SRHO_G00049460 [Serrasalmus rhombeus]
MYCCAQTTSPAKDSASQQRSSISQRRRNYVENEEKYMGELHTAQQVFTVLLYRRRQHPRLSRVLQMDVSRAEASWREP